MLVWKTLLVDGITIHSNASVDHRPRNLSVMAKKNQNAIPQIVFLSMTNAELKHVKRLQTKVYAKDNNLGKIVCLITFVRVTKSVKTFCIMISAIKFKSMANIAFKERKIALLRQIMIYIALKVIVLILCVNLIFNVEKNYAAI